MAPHVTVGSFGFIKPMLTELSRRKDFADLVFNCADGSLKCHRFVIGAQSKFLHGLMLGATTGGGDADDSLTVIAMPGVQSSSLKIVLKFLYTGKLKIRASQLPTVKELLEKILVIDARLTLPETAVIADRSDWPSGGNPPNGDEDDGQPEGSGRDLEQHPSSSGEDQEPSQKRRRDEPHPSSSSYKGERLQTIPLDLSTATAPLSPPCSMHSMDGETVVVDDDEDEDLVDLLDEGEGQSEGTQGVEEDRDSSGHDGDEIVLTCKYCPLPFYDEASLQEHIVVHLTQPDDVEQSALLVEAPRVIAKHTGGSRSSYIPTAPKRVMAKSTGGPRRVKRKRAFSTPEGGAAQTLQARTDVTTPPASGTAAVADELLPQDVSFGQRRTRSQTSGTNFHPDYSESEEIALPPPIPIPPEHGMVIYQGQWVTQEHVKKAKAKNHATNPKKVKGYNYKPTVFTLSGKSKPSTFAAAELEEDGEYPCPFEGCDSVYARHRSLNVHISRNHHDNLKATCPECNKGLSSPAAISKHLLTHRPREFWPYFCPLCERKFQAKGDLPKHFLTALHRNDNIPEVGTDDWKRLCDSGVCAPQMSTISGRPVSWRKRVLDSAPFPPTPSVPIVSGLASSSSTSSRSEEQLQEVNEEDLSESKNDILQMAVPEEPVASTSNSMLLDVTNCTSEPAFNVEDEVEQQQPSLNDSIDISATKMEYFPPRLDD